MMVRHFLDFAFHAGGMGNSLCTVVAGLLLASTLDVSFMDRRHTSNDQSITKLLGMSRGDGCGVACGAGRVAPGACAAGLVRARLDFRGGSRTCRTPTANASPQFLDQAKVEAWRARLAGEDRGLVLELRGEGTDSCNLCTHAHPRVAEILRERRLAFHPRLDGPTICGDVPKASLPPGTLTVGIHVRRGDCPKWRYVGWSVYRAVLAELQASLKSSAPGSARSRYTSIFACVITEDPRAAEAELQGAAPVEGATVRVKKPRARARSPATQPPPRRSPPHQSPLRRKREPHRQLLSKHSNGRQFDDFLELSDDFDVIVDSLSSFVYFAALYERGLKLMLTWTMPYAHLGCALPVRWSRPALQSGKWTYPRTPGPLLDASDLAGALERYAAGGRNGSCYALDEDAMAPYVNPAAGAPTPLGWPLEYAEPAPGSPVLGVPLRPTNASAGSSNASAPRATPWTAWPGACVAAETS
jgi:hypothetical protein